MTITAWYLLVACAAVVASLVFVRIAERVGRIVGMVDRPRRGELQEVILPRTGGYGVFAACWTAILVSFLVAPPALERLPADNARLLGVLLGALALLPLAVVDDLRRLPPVPQLLGQIIAAAIPTLFGLRMDEIATPLGLLEIPDLLAGPLAIFWMVAMMNAINLLDTMDGVAGGVSAIASFVLFLRSSWFGQDSIAVVPLALGASCLGFLTRNWFPSRVILGSSGALFLGYLLGAVTVMGGVKIGTAFLVLAVPILDVAWVAYRRVVQGRSPFRGGDAEHLPHRLRRLGMSTPAIVLSLYGVCGLVGAAVLLMHSASPGLAKAYLAGGVVVTVLTGLALVARATAQPSNAPDAETPAP